MRGSYSSSGDKMVVMAVFFFFFFRFIDQETEKKYATLIDHLLEWITEAAFLERD